MSERETPAAEAKPAEKKEKKKRLKGFAGMIGNLLKPLNESDRFKERFAQEVMTFVIVATDLPPAAVIKVNKGTIEIEDVALEDVKKVKKNALLQGTMDVIMKVASNKINPITAALKGQIKLKGPLKLLKLNKMFIYAMKQAKGGAPPKQPAPASPDGGNAPGSEAPATPGK
nr:SCP2 sterol-binding domain-containing protein [Candidatus Sigynarchaeota archaeon]